MRRQPVRIVDGRVEGGYTGIFELICPGCGDNPYVDYSEIPPRLQWLRGPRTLKAALEAYDKHLGPFPGPNGDSAASLGPGSVSHHAGHRRRPLLRGDSRRVRASRGRRPAQVLRPLAVMTMRWRR